MQQTAASHEMTTYATFARRFWAWAIDFAISFCIPQVLFGLFTIAQIIMDPPDGASNLVTTGAVRIGFVYVLLPIVSIGYHAGFESSRFQATPGKMMLGLRVTDIDGQRLKFNRALARHWAMCVSNITFGYGYLLITRDQKRQGLHDKIANCLVVRGAKILGCGSDHNR